MKKILLGAFCLMPGLLFAQGFQVNLQGQRQTAMAGAGVGTAMDEASVFFNPGAVTMLKQNGVMGGASVVLLKAAFQRSGSNTTENNLNEVPPPFAAYAVWGPKSGKFKLGIGAYTPFGGTVNWGEEWTGKYALTSLNLRAIFIQPTLSIKLSEAVGIGAGFVYNRGSVNLQRLLPLANANGQVSRATLDGSGDGYGWNAGIYIKTKSNVTIGLTHRSKVVTKLENGDAKFEVPAALSANFPQPNTFSSELPLPATTSLGIGYSTSAKTTLALDVNWVQWSVYQELAFDYANNTPTLADTRSPRNYQDAAALRLGIQQQLTNKFQLRGGVGYTFTPVRDGFVTPESPDANRIILSTGFGYQVSKKFSFDTSFQFQSVEKRTQTNIETGLAGTFKSNIYIPGISVSYRW